MADFRGGHLLQPGRPHVEYDYPDGPEMPLVVRDLSGGAIIFARGINVVYNYDNGVAYRFGIYIENMKHAKSAVKKFLKLTKENGTEFPDRTWIVAANASQGQTLVSLIIERSKQNIHIADIEGVLYNAASSHTVEFPVKYGQPPVIDGVS